MFTVQVKGRETKRVEPPLPPCPHCGKRGSVYRNVRAYGWCEEWFDEEGYRDCIETDGLRFSQTRCLRCEHCGKVRHDLKVEGGRVVPV